MKRILPVVIILLLAPMVLAETTYWTVVYDDAPVEDVITAANFAASMKASTGVEFSGRTFTQAVEDAPSASLLTATVVVIDGNDATIMTRDSKSSVVRNAEAYLEGQGLNVETTLIEYEFFRLEEQETEPESESLPEPVLVDDEEPSPEPEPEPVVVPEPEPEPEEKPNVIVRIWRWFTGIFS